MKTIFETVQPRPEVLKGELTDEMFAARLKDVVEGTADPVYGSADRFFENTFFTEGLRTLLREVSGRLSGASPTNSPFVRLETSFGGGKTHNLIALWHLAAAHDRQIPASILPASHRPREPWKAVALVGSDMDPSNGIDHGNVKTRSLWGEIAFQLGGPAGFDLVKESDVSGAAPGTGFLERLVGNSPCLVMLDEMARYLRSGKAVPTANGKSNVAEQTVAFLMTLIEFAASRPHVSIVVTLADSRDAFGSETDSFRRDLDEAKRVAARQERVITPTGETEISRIVTHRLFANVEAGAAKEAARELSLAYEEMSRKGGELPSRAVSGEYRSEIELDYPFHPELLTTLDRKTATIPNFQKTRGALRLLARVVRQLWQERPPNTFTIGLPDVDLSIDDVANDLTSRLERPQFRSVIEADLFSAKTGSLSHCQMLDRTYVEAGKPPYASRLATAILIHSLTQGIATGVELPDLLLATAGPGDDPQNLRRALARMLGEEKGEAGTACWFLHYDGVRYRFKTEPNLEMVVQQEMAHVGRSRARSEVNNRIELGKVWKKGILDPIPFPSEPGDLADDADKPKLAIINYDAACAESSEPPDLVQRLFEKAGTKEGFRSYKNNVLFLVADKGQVERMVDVAQRLLALERLLDDADRLRELSEDQRKKLRSERDTAELEVHVAITRAYKHLFYPAADGTKGLGLAHETLPSKEQGQINQDQCSAVLQVLRSIEKVLTADDSPLAPAHVKAKAWGHGRTELTTEELRKEFARRIGLRILLDPNQLKKVIRAGVSQGTWVYFDSNAQAAYGKISPPPPVEISDDAILYLPEEAARKNLKIRGEEKPVELQECPMCGKLPCVCGDAPAETKNTPSALLRLRETGAPGQVFQRIRDRFGDKNAGPIGSLVLTWTGLGKDAAAQARAFGLAIPQLPKGKFRVSQSFAAEFTSGDSGETLIIEFAGTAERHRRLRSLTDEMGKEAKELSVKLALEAEYSPGLSASGTELQTMREVFTQLGIDTITVDVAERAPEGGA